MKYLSKYLLIAIVAAVATLLSLNFAASAGGLTCQGKDVEIVGTNGNDTLTGTGSRDVIAGLGGADDTDGRG